MPSPQRNIKRDRQESPNSGCIDGASAMCILRTMERSTDCDPVDKPSQQGEVESIHDRCDRDGTHDSGTLDGTGP